MRLDSGSTLGPYEIIGPIGAGGMGEVYRARDSRLGREVAIKVLPHKLAGHADRLTRFEREARGASALNHPNIITVYDFTSTGGETYLVMELVRGESLREIVSRGPVPLKRLFSIAAGVASGLAAAHAAALVHRDLKPENIMVTSDGTPKILDFGLVKATTASAGSSSSDTQLEVTGDGVVVGTTSYMSPEQARGTAIDFRSDQFSLGLILHEMATGKHPFHHGSSVETLARILNAEPEPLDAGAPQPFAWIVERCLEKDHAHRYGSTADLAYDLTRLRDHASSGGIRALPASAAPSLRRWWVAAAVAGVMVAAISILAWAARRPASATVSDWIRADISTAAIAEVTRGAVALPVVISPDGRHLALYGVDEDGTHDLWLHHLRDGSTKRIADQAFAAAWSSDSKSVAYFAEGKLKVVSIDGGPPRIVCDAGPEGTPTWHGDTILFAQYSRNPGIHRVAASGGTPQLVVPPGAPAGEGPFLPWMPEFLPDGKRFLYLVLRQPRTIGQEVGHDLFVGSLDGAEPRHIAAISSRAMFAEGHLLFVRDGTLLAQPFDVDRVRLTGDARPLLDGLHYFRNTGLAAFSVSTTGVLAWRSALPPVRLVWLDRTGAEVGALATVPGSYGGRLSPDFKRFAVDIVDPRQGVADIWVYDIARESSDRMTFQLLDETNPVWAPDGTIYFRSDGGGGPPDIFRMRPGASRREIAHQGPGVEEPHDVSADGKWLLFIEYRPPVDADIKVLPLSPPGEPRDVAATPFQELWPRFSPDGRQVAYASDVSGRSEVYVRPFDGAASPRRISRDGGTRPRWNRDGQELFFLAPGGRLMTVAGSPEFGVPRLLFQATAAKDFDVAEGGRRFLVHLEEGSTKPSVHLLVNWPARLR